MGLLPAGNCQIIRKGAIGDGPQKVAAAAGWCDGQGMETPGVVGNRWTRPVVDTVTPTAAVAVNSTDVNLVNNTATVTFDNTWHNADGNPGIGPTSPA
jgi:hypothetical protein